MLWRNLIAVAACLLALTLTIAGCGGSDDAAEVTAEGTLAKAQYLKQASRICRQGNAEFTDRYAHWERTHTVDGRRPPELARDIALSRFVLAGRIRQLDRLKELGLPREAGGFVPRLYEAWEEGIENAEEHPESMRESLERFAFRNAYVMSVDYGLVDCWLS